MKSSEGSQLMIRDLRMPPSLGDTTGRVTSLGLPEEPEGGTQGSTPRWGSTAEWEAAVGAHTENNGVKGPQRPPKPLCTRALTFLACPAAAA